MKSIGPLNHSLIESKRFDLKVYRGVIDDINPKEILSTVLKENIDVAIIRIPSERQDALVRLEKTGIPYLIADTLVYYHVDLKTYEPGELRNRDLEFIEFYPEHFEIMDKLVSEIFSAYKNHYTSNPLLAVDLIEAYKEWARSYVTNETDGKCGWLVKRGDRFIGFATCTFEGDESEIVLNGVVPSAAGMGVYGDLIKFLQQFFKDNGYSIMKVSTQVYNYAVQKVWSREGFVMKQSFVTVHINSMMNVSRIEKRMIDCTISTGDVRKYGHMFGDTNRLHFDEEYARNKGFEGRIVHELLANSAISKYYGTEFPGDGTVVVGYSYKFLKPIYLDQPYRIEISFPFVNSEMGIYKSLAKILDSNGDICLFSYNDLMKK